MPESALARKMKLKSGAKAVVVNPPDGYLAELRPLPNGVSLGDKLQGSFDWIQIFVKNEAELEKTLPRAIKAMKPVSILWISFPKGTSKIQTDLTRDKGWEALEKADLKWLTLVSVNAVWSAFAARPFKSGEAR
ncbi:MAG: hypothetical protein A2Z37_02400 [Chloroflexi bacterium RBG_19FT_COMBO_62_14]|nr:MAG: hypothetical protein A2Z37_02400 [Chloroflexi bacterium RBG_19FT_COMBO_62_14]